MTKRSRTILFLFLGAVFLAGTPAIIFYSQGYRFDWQERWFSQVGAFYLNINPAQAEVFVNDQSIGRTTRILGTTLAENFLPNTYLIRVEKEGYHSWEKRLQVFPRQVTEAKNIVLVPKDPAFTPLPEDAQALLPSPNGEESVPLDTLKDATDLETQYPELKELFSSFTQAVLSPDGKKIALSVGSELWLYYLQDEREQPSNAKGERIFLTRFGQDISNLAWFTPHYLLFTKGDTIMISEIDTRDRLNMVELASFPNPELVWQPAEKTLLVYTGDQILVSNKLLP